ncbi:hypothetical protein BJX61DRAFT_515749 [Aspergillus egyptiacus]|nr:hypothetical protein BJX61DRAFT_515749 [Aspergillus egyptiacus]
MHASWRLYEEPGSKSGLPEIVRLLLLVDSEAEFGIRLSMAVKACHRFTFGIPRTMTAAAGRSYQVPPLGVISLYEQESRLKQMLAVADRAATVAEEADRLEARFSRAIRNHAKRDLILQAGMKESHSQEWVDIVDASLLNDFRNLREKLLEMEDRKRRSRRRSRTSNPRLQRELEERIILEESWRRDRHRRTEPRGDRSPVVEEHPRAKNALESFSAVGPGYHVSRLA